MLNLFSLIATFFVTMLLISPVSLNNETSYGSFSSDESLADGLTDCDRSGFNFGSTRMFNYFNNLTNNFGNNAEPVYSCGYVALAMLLNYFDTMFDDSIVEEKYESNTTFDTIHFNGDVCESPGTTYEASSGITNITPQQYINYIRTYYSNSSLHAKLILLFYDARDEYPNMGLQWYFGTNLSKLATITDLYYSLSNYPYSFQYSYDTDSLYKFADSEEKEAFFDYIDSSLEADIPVMLGFGGHLSVVFAKRSGQYYYHRGIVGPNRIGYKNADAIMTELTYSEDLIMFRLLFSNISNSGSYHYHSSYYNDDNTYNGSFINHNFHSYVYNYFDYTVNKHHSYCKCNQYIDEQHLYLKNLHYSEEYCVCGRRNPFYV